jgi:hypothetical protein
MLTARAGGQSKPIPAALTMQSERTGIENKWFALTGRVVELKVEEDGAYILRCTM